MTGSEYKKFTKQAKAAIKREAFFEALVSDYSLPHHIVGSKEDWFDYRLENDPRFLKRVVQAPQY